MLLPVATGSEGGQLKSVTWVVMQVTQTGANTHSGRVLGDASTLVQRQP